jgi:hypothetical protein
MSSYWVPRLHLNIIKHLFNSSWTLPAWGLESLLRCSHPILDSPAIGLSLRRG